MNQPNPSSDPPSTADSAAPPPKPRKRRWFLKCVGVVLLIVILLVVFLPQIAGLGFVRSFVVGKINNSLNGKAAINSWSLSWTGGVTVDGVTITDEQGTEILKVDAVKTQLSLIDAARGKLQLGRTEVKGVEFVIKVDESGKTNFEKIAKTTSSESSGPIPDLSGDFLVEATGRIEQPGKPTVFVDLLKVGAKVPGINETISPDATVVIKVGDKGAPGTIALNGSARVFSNGQVDLDKLTADADLTIASLDLGAANPFIPAELATKVAGLTNGAFKVKADGLRSASVDGQLQVTEMLYSGPQLKGDTFTATKVTIPISATRTVVDDKTTRIKISRVRAELPQLYLDLAGEFTEQSLERVASQKPPGQEGWLSMTLDVTGVKQLAEQLPNTLKVLPDTTIEGGRCVAKVEVAMTPEKVFVKKHFDVTDLKGRNKDGPIAVAPLSLSADAAYVPGEDPLKGISDVAIVLTSDFIQMAGGGVSLGKLNVGGNFDLNKLRQQVGQFVDLQQAQCAGTGSFSIDTTGDLAKPNAPMTAKLQAGLKDLRLSLPNQPPLDFSRLVVQVDGNLLTGGDQFVRAIQNATVKLQSGDEKAPIIDLSASASGIDLATQDVQRFEVSNLVVGDLKAAQNQLDPFVPALREQKLQITAGQLYLSAAGSYDAKNQVVKLDKPLEMSTPGLSVQKLDSAGNAVPLVSKEKFTVRLAGSVAMSSGLAAELTQLFVGTSSNLVTVDLSKDKPTLSLAIDGPAIRGNGAVTVNADLKRLNQLSTALSGAAQPAPGAAGELLSGQFASTIGFSRTGESSNRVDFSGQITNLSVTTADPKQPISNESVTIALVATSPDDLSNITASGKIGSSFVTADLKNVAGSIKLPGEGSTASPQFTGTADVTAAIPDLPKLYRIANALAPAAAPEPGTQPVTPLDITSGAASLAVSVKRDAAVTRVDLTDAQFSKVALARGKRSYAFDPSNPITASLSAELSTNALQQVTAIKVTRLNADARVAKLSMPGAIDIGNLDGDSPVASGAIALTGTLANVTPLLAVLQDADELPYRGDFVVNQRLSNKGNEVQLVGDITAKPFQVLNRVNRDKVDFTEPEVLVRNDLTVDAKLANASVNSLTVDLPSSKAVGMKMTGTVKDWVKKRNLDAKLDLTYDLARVWPIVKPMLSMETQETMKDAKLVGAYTETFTVTGSYPDKPFNQAIRSVLADGKLDVDLINAAGIDLQKLTLLVSLKDGVASLKQPTAAVCNTGKLNLDGFLLDLTADEPRLTGPKKQRLMQDVTINPLLGDTLGKYINPVFANSKRASGLLDVTVDYIKAVGVVSKWQQEDSGSARIVISIRDLDIANPVGSLMIGGLLKLIPGAGGASSQSDTFRGEIRDAVVTLDKGRTTQELTLNLSVPEDPKAAAAAPTNVKPQVYPLTFKGDIRLSDLKQNLQVNLPTALVVGTGNDTDIRRIMNSTFPSGIPLSMRGTTTKPEVDYGNFAQKFIEGQIKSGLTGGKDGGGLLEDLLGGGKKNKDSDDGGGSKKKKK